MNRLSRKCPPACVWVGALVVVAGVASSARGQEAQPRLNSSAEDAAAVRGASNQDGSDSADTFPAKLSLEAADGSAADEVSPPSETAPEVEPEPAKEAPKEWEFTLAPYVWMMSINADVDAGPVSTEADICFTDLLKNMDMAAQVRFEGLRKQRWGFYLDWTYVQLSNDVRARIGPFKVRGLDVDARFTQSWLDFGGMYRFGEKGRSLDVMLGGRYTYLAADVSVGPFLDVDKSKDFVALVVGARVEYALTDKWLVSVRGDIAGFGIGDAANLTWGVTGLLGYRLTEHATLGFGYRYYHIDYSSGALSTDLQFHGPLVGIAFQF